MTEEEKFNEWIEYRKMEDRYPMTFHPEEYEMKESIREQIQSDAYAREHPKSPFIM